jgi:N-acetylneuraminic acid mutarotase
MMHQSCIVKNSKGDFRLLCLGGKVGIDQSSSGYTDSVIGYDCRFLFNPYIRYKFDPENKIKMKWESLSNMNNQRANFAICQIDNFVYVFGGIQSKEKGNKTKHIPQIVEQLTEKYCATTDVWEKIEIANAPPLAAFAWTPLSNGKIMILGGSDGDLLQDGNWIIDFKKLTAQYEN